MPWSATWAPRCAAGSSCGSSSARDSARVQGGIGSCGRDLCCATFLTDFEPVTIRMAKDQDLPLNPLRISGACGRLMCCLKYEHPLYQQFQATAPAMGTTLQLWYSGCSYFRQHIRRPQAHGDPQRIER